MRLILPVASFFLLIITGCGRKSAFDYSEKLVKIEQGLTPDIVDTENKVGKFFANEEYDSAAAVSQRMEDKIESKINEVEKIDAPDVKEAENFKRAYLKYFSYIKSIYTAYRQFAMETDFEKKDSLRLHMLKIADDKKDVIEEVQRVQAKYAKANGFRLEK